MKPLFRNESIERAWIEIGKRKTPEQWYSHWDSQSDISAIAKSILKGHALNNESVFEYFKILTPYYIEHNFRYITHHPSQTVKHNIHREIIPK
jgi:hypothetical protein